MPPNPKPLLLVDDDTGLLRQLRWAFSDHKVFPAATRQEAIDFVNKVAQEAEKMDHHPDIDIRWNKVKLVLSTHSAGGLTNNDFMLATKVDKLAP